MSIKIADNVYWVGKVDWELRTFHGEELSTHRGSTYNSYLIKDEKNVLIDTVWAPFAAEFIEKLKQNIELDKIDYVVVLHGEKDHSGALPELMKLIPDKPVYCTANGVKSLQGQYHQDWNFVPVKTGDRLNIGSRELTFIEAAMLHWPDTMFCYMSGENILFSNDAFGQHYASETMFNDMVSESELYQEAIKYYANILTPFSRLVEKKIKDVLDLGLPVDMICPSHGVMWRENPLQIVEAYRKWADDYQENQVTILYDTMWNGTRKMAESIAEGIASADGAVTIKLFNIGRSDKNDAITEIFKSKAILVGSPTVNRGVLSAVGGIMEEMRGLGFKKKKSAAFGAYGWSGEGIKVLSNRLQECGFEVVNDGLRELWYPGEKEIENCRRFGQGFAAIISI